MVRIGEYSPNFRGNKLVIEGDNRGIFGFGEYEEKRKYYNEQRKLEYKQYIAQQALNSSCSGGSDSVLQITTVEPTFLSKVHLQISSISVATSVRKDVATQTSSRELRDACTNTVVPVSTECQENNLPAGRLPGNLKHDSVNTLTSQIKGNNGNHLNAASQYHQELRAQIEEKKNQARELERRERQEAESRERWIAEEARRELERRVVEEKKIKGLEDYLHGGVAGNLKQDSVNTFTSQIKENNRHYLNAASQYERELHAQIEEKKNHARELERRERQEAESRERWIAEKARRELERHRVEEMRLKALEDCRRQRLEEFRNCSEQLQMEAKESRRMKIRGRRDVSSNVTARAGSDSNGNVFSSREILSQQVSKSIPKLSAIQSQVSDKLKLNRKQCHVQEECLEQSMSRQEASSKATAKETTPKTHPLHLQKGKDSGPLLSPEEGSRSKILSHLGEIRRCLATEQIKMEGALKKINSPDKKM